MIPRPCRTPSRILRARLAALKAYPSIKPARKAEKLAIERELEIREGTDAR